MAPRDLEDQELPDGEDDQEVLDQGDGEREDAEEGEGQDDAGPEVEGEEDEEVAPRGRASERVRTLATRAKESEAARQATETKLQTLERELNELRQARGAPQQETAEQEAGRLALMTTEERIEYRLAKAERSHQQQIQQMRFESADRSDRAEFQAKAAMNPLYAKHAAKVEAELATIRRSGQTVEREKLLMYLVGQEVVANAAKAGSKQREAGQRNVKRHTARPSAGQSDQQAPSRRGGQSLEDRLANVIL